MAGSPLAAISCELRAAGFVVPTVGVLPTCGVALALAPTVGVMCAVAVGVIPLVGVGVGGFGVAVGVMPAVGGPTVGVVPKEGVLLPC